MKVLIDSSAWISHLRKPHPQIISLLEAGDALTHPAIIGELACGNFRHRASFLSDLKCLPRADEASPDEILKMIEVRKLYGKGLGWVDCQLLASSGLSGAAILTEDKALRHVASALGIS